MGIVDHIEQVGVVHLADIGDVDAAVLDRTIEAFAAVAGLQTPGGCDGPVYTGHELVLFHWLQSAGNDSRVAGISLGCTEIDVFNEASYVNTRRGSGRRTASAQRKGRGNFVEVGIIHGINAIVPIVAAK